MRFQRFAAAAATTALAASLVACGAAEDAANQAKEKASEAAASAANEATEKVKEKASDAAGSLYQDVLEKLSPEQQEKLKGLEAVALGTEGELVEDADSLTVAEYFAARQAAAANSGEDLTALEAVAAGRGLRNATRYITKNAGKTPDFVVNVVTSDSGRVEACVGPKGKKARLLVVKDGKVVKNAKGTHVC